MAHKNLFTAHDYAKKIASLDRHIMSLHRQKGDLEAKIKAAKNPTHLLLLWLAPMYRRGTALTLQQMRREASQLDLKIFDLQSEKQALMHEQKQMATDLEDNARLLEQEESLQREVRWLHLKEKQRDLKKRKAAFEKVQAQEQLAEREQLLKQEMADLQEQLAVVRGKMEKGKERQFSLMY